MKNLLVRSLFLVCGLLFTAIFATGQESGNKQTVKLKVIKGDKTVVDTVITKAGKVDQEEIDRIIKTGDGKEVRVMVREEGGEKFVEIVSDSVVKVIMDTVGGKKVKHAIVTLADPDMKGTVVYAGKGDHGMVTVMAGTNGNKTVRIQKVMTCEKDSCMGKKCCMKAEGKEGLIKIDEGVAVVEPLGGKVEDRIIIREGIPITDISSFEKENEVNGIHLENLGEGSFRLGYRSEDLKPIKIEVFDGEGNRLFDQKVKNFLGKYVKDIYLMENDPGFYLVRVRQGDKEEIGEFQFK